MLIKIKDAMHQQPISRQNKKEKTKPLRDSIMGKLREDLLGGDKGGHRLLSQAIARHQALVEAQWLSHRKPVDLGEVGPHRQLRHCQGNPGPAADVALNGGSDTMACDLEPVLPGA
jgi:hypothetical protein